MVNCHKKVLHNWAPEIKIYKVGGEFSGSILKNFNDNLLIILKLRVF